MDMCFTPELEDQIWTLEGIRVVIRAPKNVQFSPYNYSRKLSATSSITDWINGRLKPIIGDYGFSIIDGNGEIPHGRTSMDTLRKSYF